MPFLETTQSCFFWLRQASQLKSLKNCEHCRKQYTPIGHYVLGQIVDFEAPLFRILHFGIQSKCQCAPSHVAVHR